MWRIWSIMCFITKLVFNHGVQADMVDCFEAERYNGGHRRRGLVAHACVRGELRAFPQCTSKKLTRPLQVWDIFIKYHTMPRFLIWKEYKCFYNTENDEHLFKAWTLRFVTGISRCGLVGRTSHWACFMAMIAKSSCSMKREMTNSYSRICYRLGQKYESKYQHGFLMSSLTLKNGVSSLVQSSTAFINFTHDLHAHFWRDRAQCTSLL